MDSGWASAVASIVTALIVLGTVIAAFLQLRHNRNANDIAVYFRLVDMMDSEIARRARESSDVVVARLADPQFRIDLTDPRSVTPEMSEVGFLLRFLEHVSVLIVKGGVAENLVLAEYADTFLEMWNELRPAILLRRKAFGPYTGRAFEHLAMRAKTYIESGGMERDYASLQRDERPEPTW